VITTPVPLWGSQNLKLLQMCLTTATQVTNINSNNYLTSSSNPVTLPTNMDHLQSLPAPLGLLASPRLSRLGHPLEPLRPARQGDNKRKRLNAVLDKLTNNINKVSEDASGGEAEPDSPDKNLEIEFNVKTKFKKEESEDTSGDSDSGEASSALSLQPEKLRKISEDSVTPTPNEDTNTFFNSMLLKSPQCDTKLESNTAAAAAAGGGGGGGGSSGMISSYEEYVLKSHLLSKMYLQQYCSAELNIAKNANSSEKPSKERSSKPGPTADGRRGRRKEGGGVESPLDLSTRNLEHHHQALKEHLYPHNFPFASLQQMLLQSATQEGKAQLGIKQAETPTPSPATSEPADRETSKDLSYVCPICGQMFGLHDRLAKHMASRHKSKPSAENSTKAYFCDVCKRSFARSDMLTRHMRLHTGIKPYTCTVCGQVFSRSDHLSTHQRTHTGEKPYKCPSCPYSACRRDMITRHMRTHSRYELPDNSPIVTSELARKEPNGQSRQYVKEEFVDS